MVPWLLFGSADMRVIWLKVILETVEAASQRLSFKCSGGEQAISCSITVDALDDLIRFHRLDVSQEKTVDALLKEVERLANEKFDDGRVERNGELAINATDVLRYGFQTTDDSAT
jgi:hypothetical protein